MRVGQWLRNVYSTNKVSRFYQWAEVVPKSGGQLYAVRLDGRPIRTPAGRVLEVNSEPLALAVAAEWQSQSKRINMSRMHLTSLTITAIDNPHEQSVDSLTKGILNHLDSDTLLYMSDQPEELRDMQLKQWGTVIDWAMKRFDVHLAATTALNSNMLSNWAKGHLEKYLSANSFAALLGCQFVVESLKSVLLLLAALENQVGVEEAVQLATLERRFQTSRWGEVQWAHDVEHHDMCCRVAAGLFFAYFHANQQQSASCSPNQFLM